MAKKKTASKSGKQQATQEEQLSRFHDVFGELHKFVETIRESEDELKEADAAVSEAKRVYDEAKDHAAKVRDMLTGAKHGLFRYLAPIDGGEVLPLFDRMEPADEEKHGEHASEWRTEPIAALRLSLPSQIALTDAEIMLVGQLQDRVLAKPDDWWMTINGLTAGSAAAICDRLNDFINERTTR
jgi:hypothetical protein